MILRLNLLSRGQDCHYIELHARWFDERIDCQLRDLAGGESVLTPQPLFVRPVAFGRRLPRLERRARPRPLRPRAPHLHVRGHEGASRDVERRRHRGPVRRRVLAAPRGVARGGPREVAAVLARERRRRLQIRSRAREVAAVLARDGWRRASVRLSSWRMRFSRARVTRRVGWSRTLMVPCVLGKRACSRALRVRSRLGRVPLSFLSPGWRLVRLRAGPRRSPLGRRARSRLDGERPGDGASDAVGPAAKAGARAALVPSSSAILPGSACLPCSASLTQRCVAVLIDDRAASDARWRALRVEEAEGLALGAFDRTGLIDASPAPRAREADSNLTHCP